MAELKYEIVQNVAVLSENTKGWKKELNIISWNDRKPKLDIREWDENHEKMSKGITLNKEEASELKRTIMDLDLEVLT